ncbi:hypothetical protein ACFYT3_05370 [Nocardia amikacinitolerans]|uniref:hypothetical protein n=1 Tax=Nocardia amikacinitolerans TaxID=756689 RepID=UPI0036C7E1AD
MSSSLTAGEDPKEDFEALRTSLNKIAQKGLRNVFKQVGDEHEREHEVLVRIVKNVAGEERWQRGPNQAMIDVIYAAIGTLSDEPPDPKAVTAEASRADAYPKPASEIELAEILFGFADTDVAEWLGYRPGDPEYRQVFSYGKDYLPFAFERSGTIHAKGGRSAERFISAVRESLAKALLKVENNPKIVKIYRRTLNPQRGYLRLTEYTDRLDTALSEARRGIGPRTVVISGGPGYGKTMLAEDWATNAGEREGLKVCFIRLFGYNAKAGRSRTTATGALTELYNFFGLRLSLDTVNDVEAEFRRLAAEHELIVVLDDAANEGHVKELLPRRGDSYFVVVTSRPPLNMLQTSQMVESLPLRRLDLDRSVELLRLNISADLIQSNSSLDLLAKYACGIPIALRVVAARLESGYESISELAESLGEAGALLDPVSPGDEATNLRVIFQSSYKHLDENSQRTYRMLSARLGAGIDTYSAGLVADLSERESKQVVTVFESLGLIDRLSGYRFDVHDLLRDYATEECIKADEFREATDRLLQGYYGCVNLAFDKANPKNPMVDGDFINPDGWRGHQAADRWISRSNTVSAWFAGEREAFVDLAKRACEMEPPARFGPRLAASLFYLLEIGNWWDDWKQVTDAGLEALDRQDDPPFRGFLLRNRARIAMIEVRDDLDRLRLAEELPPDKATDLRERCEQAISQYGESIQLLGQPGAKAVAIREVADTRLQLGRVEPTMDNLDAARDAYLTAEQLFANQPNPLASLSLSLGDVYALMGSDHYINALELYNNALAYALEPLDDRPYTHGALAGHGLAKRAVLMKKMGDEQEAARSFDEALKAFRYYNNWRDEARVLVRKCIFLADLLEQDELAANLAHAHAMFTEHRLAEDAEVVTELQMKHGFATA